MTRPVPSPNFVHECATLRASATSTEPSPSRLSLGVTTSDTHQRSIDRLRGRFVALLGELRAARGEELGRRWAAAERTKTSEARVIPIGPRLRAELVMRRDGPDGQPLPLSARVFGNEVERAGRLDS